MLLNNFTLFSAIFKDKYNHIDPQWINKKFVIFTIDLIIDPNKPDMYMLDSFNVNRLNKFIINLINSNARYEQ
jgi:hypothetical protein